LAQSPPGCQRAEKAGEEAKDLPHDGRGGQEAGGDKKDRSQKRTEGSKGGSEFGWSEKFGNPGEGPVVPVETQPGDDESIGEEGKEGKEGGNGFFCEFWHWVYCVFRIA